MNNVKLFLQRCFDLANLATGKVSPNPKVGAVITHHNKIIGEGYHQYAGGPHAEINAINSLKDKTLLPKSTIYISLEPCNNFGKTPPCVNAILKYQIPNVVIGIVDPNLLTMGKSIDKLKAAGVNVTVSKLSKKAIETSKFFFTRILHQRPYIVLKYAQSKNRKVGINGQNIWLSNAFTKRLTHKWRSELNAILIGSNTLMTDKPQLNNRLYFGNSPIKLLIKRDGLLPKERIAFYAQTNTIIIHEASKTIEPIDGIQYWSMNFDKKLLPNLLRKLYEAGINSLLIEGGAKLLTSFIEEDLWDEARVFTSSRAIESANSISAPNLKHSRLIKTVKIADNTLELFSRL